jgi:SAM-dependent methyltransferase
VPAGGRLLDVGCGPGTPTIDLATASSASVTALDNHRPYLERLRERAQAAGVSRRIQTVQASMFSLPFRQDTFDLIWSEGAIFILGFERGLEEWRALLRPGGRLAVTHLSWLTPDIPREPLSFWSRNYPAIRSVDDNLGIATRSGFEPIEVFTLPESAWWDDYYRPMEARLAVLRPQYRDDAEALAVIDSSAEQIDLYRRFSRCYGYVFYVLRKI